MTTKMLRFTLASLMLVLLPLMGIAESRLFVPRFDFGPQQDTQFLLVNSNDHESSVDLWAFTAAGELLGQLQLQMKERSTRSITLSEAFGLKSGELNGWLGVVSQDDGIQLSYSRVGPRDGSFAAQEWSSQRQELPVVNARQQVLRISNPNAFETQVTLIGLDESGAFMATRDVVLAPFSQTEAALNGLLSAGGRIALNSNAEVISEVDDLFATPRAKTETASLQLTEQQIDLIFDTEKRIGAYQVTLTFDPKVIQFGERDILAGSVEGFESRPLAVNIDNAAGEITIGSFQVGGNATGRVPVARLVVKTPRFASPRFGIRLDSLSDETGSSMAARDVTVGLVRVQ